MEISRNGVVPENLCRTIIIPLIIFVSVFPIAGESRDLRPSEHGLTFQASPEADNLTSSAAMRSFFGQETFSASLPPAAPNSSDSSPEQWRPPQKSERRRLAALTVAAIVCGGAGGVLLVAAFMLFAFRFRRGRSGDSPVSGGAAANANK